MSGFLSSQTEQARKIASVEAENQRLREELELVKAKLCKGDPGAAFCR